MLFEHNSRPTACVSGGRGWVRKRLEMWKKLKARKMPVKRADSPPSAARHVGKNRLEPDALAENPSRNQPDQILPAT